MEQQPVSLDDLNLLSTSFTALSSLIERFGAAGLIDTSGEWREIPLLNGVSIRSAFSGDGYVWFQALLEDVVRVQVRGDVLDDQPWKSVESRFGVDGELTSVRIIKDNGLIRDDYYDEGIRVAIRYTDAESDFPWQTVTNYYDALGNRTNKVTEFDDGSIRDDVYTDGQRTSTILTDSELDGVHPWQSITSNYRLDGSLESKFTVFDSGSTRFETFVDGLRTSLIVTDSDGHPWSEIHSFYDTSGDLSEKTILFDNGLERIEQWFASDLLSVEQLDLSDVYDWSWKYRQFNEFGFVSAEETRFDDGDIARLFFDNGERSSRIEYDGDGDESWLYRVTGYDESGVAAVETYQDESALMSSLLPYEVPPFDLGGSGGPNEPFPDDGVPPDLSNLTENDFIV